MTDTLGKRLKSARLAMKMSQFKLSQLIESSQGMISQYEDDKTDPPHEKMVAMARILNVDIEWLSLNKYKSNDDTPVPTIVNDQNLTVGKRLATALLRANITVDQLSLLTGISLDLINMILTDNESPRVVHIAAISGAINVDKSWLAFGGK